MGALLTLAAIGVPAAGSPPALPSPAAGDWPGFGDDAGRSDVSGAATGITATNVGRLRVRRVRLDGTVDSSPIYLRSLDIRGAPHDVFVVTTSYGRTIALDASTGAILWRFQPGGFRTWAGGARITEATPVADPERRWVYAAAPDGRIHKLSLARGREVRSGGWPVAVTRDPRDEKIGAALNLSGRFVVAATSGYIGDVPPYQGHVVAINRGSGSIAGVFNTLCSRRHHLLNPRRCSPPGAARYCTPNEQGVTPRPCRAHGGGILARAGAVIEPGSGDLLVATGNGPCDQRRSFGDSVLELSADARRLIGHWTPRNHDVLDRTDTDLGSTAPALVSYRGWSLALQSGKDGLLRLIDLGELHAGATRRRRRRDSELERVRVPGGRRGGLFTAPAVWRGTRGDTVFIANNRFTVAYRIEGARPHIRRLWRRATAGTSPVMAGGLLYVYDARRGGLYVYGPRDGHRLAVLKVGRGHWNSPIVADGRIAVPEGDANDHRESGLLTIFSLPGR